jgi:hypothetical protein
LDLLPDSLLLRSTFAALEHSASTLKRLSKSVLASTTSYLALLQQLEAVEDELFGDLGELGRWLEGGYGINDGQVWDGAGIRKVRKDARAKEKAEIEVMVQQAVRSVKVDLKRNGLAGAGAQGKFEVSFLEPTVTIQLLTRHLCAASSKGLLSANIVISCSICRKFIVVKSPYTASSRISVITHRHGAIA